MNTNAREYFLNNVSQKQDRELRFSPLEREDEAASNHVLLIFLPCFL